MKYVYEFIGAFFLVFTVGMTVLAPSTVGNLAPIAIGSALAVMVYAGGHVSGGHYNPAVSLAVYLRGRLGLQDLALYWISQLLGALVAAWLVLYFKDYSPQTLMNLNVSKAFIAEFLFTFALCYVVLNVATARQAHGNSFFGFAIGFTVTVGAYAVGAISGGAFNPAVALGIATMHLVDWSHLWLYAVANLLGAACAAFVFNCAHEE